MLSGAMVHLLARNNVGPWCTYWCHYWFESNAGA